MGEGIWWQWPWSQWGMRWRRWGRIREYGCGVGWRRVGDEGRESDDDRKERNRVLCNDGGINGEE